MARYAGLLLTLAEGKERAYFAVLAHFRTFLVFNSNLGNFQQKKISTSINLSLCHVLSQIQTYPIFRHLLYQKIHFTVDLPCQAISVLAECHLVPRSALTKKNLFWLKCFINFITNAFSIISKKNSTKKIMLLWEKVTFNCKAF